MTLPRVLRPGRSAGTMCARSRQRSYPIPALLVAVALSLSWVEGCGLSGGLPPNPIVIVATPVPRRVELPGGGTEERRRLVDGDATDPEWAEVPYFYAAMGPENGNGGGSFVASIKVAQDSVRLYMLIQWPDQNPDRLGPRLVWDSNTALSPIGCSSQDSVLLNCEWTLTDDDEDRVAVMWDKGDAADGSGTFRDRGCQVACHGNMHPASGSVDIWHWRAARTNPIQYPLIAGLRVGFADDGYADANGRVDDPGAPFFRSNVRMVTCAGGRRVPRPLKIPVALDDDGRPSVRGNDNMRPCEYIFDSNARDFTLCSRENPCRQFEQSDVVDWVQGDDLSATLLSRPANEAARRSRHDVEARGQWVGVGQGGAFKGVWTVEMSRLLATGHPEDLDFDVNRTEPYTVAIAIMNNNGEIHSGSPPIQVHLRP